jgi:hypothetical protein
MTAEHSSTAHSVTVEEVNETVFAAHSVAVEEVNETVYMEESKVAAACVGHSKTVEEEN